MATVPTIVALYSARPQWGKSTVANILRREYGYTPYPFAQPLKTMITAMFLSAGFTQEEAMRYVFGDLKEEYIPAFKSTPRHMMQTLGTEWGRNSVNPDIWVGLVERQIENALDAGERIIIDDMRFQNEFDLINKYGGTTIKVVKRQLDQIPVHDSEGALTHQRFDYIVTNNGTLEELQEQVLGMFGKIN